LTWYVAVNTFAAVQGDTVGSILGVHRTRAGAERACERVQPRETNAYLPTRIYALREKPRYSYALTVAEVRANRAAWVKELALVVGDDGTGDLGIIVDVAIETGDEISIDSLAEIVRQARRDARAERAREAAEVES